MPALFLINSKKTSKARTNKYAEMGSPWRAYFPKLKYRVVKPPFIKHGWWLFNNTFIQCMKFSPKPNLFEILNRKSWSKESNAFSISIVTR